MAIISDLSLLQPDFRANVERLLARCADDGMKVKVFETLRTAERQDELYAQGRTKAGSKVTDARGNEYKSYHQWGLAVDIIRDDGRNGWENADGFFDKIGKLGESVGLVWGGKFKKKYDGPHFQVAEYAIDRLICEYQRPENFIGNWKR